MQHLVLVIAAVAAVAAAGAIHAVVATPPAVVRHYARWEPLAAYAASYMAGDTMVALIHTVWVMRSQFVFAFGVVAVRQAAVECAVWHSLRLVLMALEQC